MLANAGVSAVIFQFQKSIYFQLSFYVSHILFSFYCISILKIFFVLVLVFNLHIIFISVSIAVFISVSRLTMLYTKSITQLCYTKATWQAGVYWSAIYSITQLHQVFVQFQKHTHLQIFREFVPAASSQPSTDVEHPLHVGL